MKYSILYILSVAGAMLMGYGMDVKAAAIGGTGFILMLGAITGAMFYCLNQKQ